MSETDTSILPTLVCVECGYALQGLKPEGDCPECGESIAHSVAAQNGFTKRELVSVACRLFALWMFLRAANATLQFGVFMFQNFQPWDWLVWAVSVVVIPVLLGALIWWRTPLLARLMVPREGVASAGPLKRDDLMRIALAVLGVYLAATGVQEVVGPLLNAWWELPRGASASSWAMLGGGIVRLCLGLGLVVGGKRLGRFVSGLRTAGTSTAKEA